MTTSPWPDLIEEARRYTSPHNSQPIKLQPIGDREARVFYDLDLGLLAESFADPVQAGTYQGVFSMGYSLGAMAAPLIVTSTALSHGFGGWAILAGVFLASGLGTWAIARGAARAAAAAASVAPAASSEAAASTAQASP